MLRFFGFARRSTSRQADRDCMCSAFIDQIATPSSFADFGRFASGCSSLVRLFAGTSISLALLPAGLMRWASASTEFQIGCVWPGSEPGKWSQFDRPIGRSNPPFSSAHPLRSKQLRSCDFGQRTCLIRLHCHQYQRSTKKRNGVTVPGIDRLQPHH